MGDVGMMQGGITSPATLPRRRGHNAGFTLLQILVVIAVVGLLTVLLSQGVRFGLVSWGRQLHDDDRKSELATVDHVLRELIGGMDPGGPPGDQVQIAGDVKSLRFTAKLPEAAQRRTRVRRANILIAMDDSNRLTLSYQPYFPSPIGPAVPARQSILLDGVEDLSISYWQPPGAGQSGAWRTMWNAREPPGLIRFRLVLARTPGMPQPIPWPDIVVAPMQARYMF